MTTFRDQDKLTDADAAEITKWIGLHGFEFHVIPGNEIFALAVGEYMPESTQALYDMARARIAGSPYIIESVAHNRAWLPCEYTITVRKPHVETWPGSGWFK